MSNPRVYVAKFDDGVKLPYINEEGSGTPLFIVEALAKAFGITPASGYWYTKSLKGHISKRRLRAGRQKMRMIHIDGVFLLLGKRHPLWEQDFRDQFRLFLPASFTKIPIVIPADNLQTVPALPPMPDLSPMPVVDFTRLIERQNTMDDKLNKLIEIVSMPTAAVIRNPKLVPIYGTNELVRVPSRAEHLFINMSRATSDHGTDRRVLKGEPIYSHVEGYRTYKEMLAAVGLDIFINTQKGRDLSRRMAKLAQKYGIKYYLVVDTIRYHQQRGEEKRKFHMGTYCINAYPEELWAVVEPVAHQYLDNLGNA